MGLGNTLKEIAHAEGTPAEKRGTPQRRRKKTFAFCTTVELSFFMDFKSNRAELGKT